MSIEPETQTEGEKLGGGTENTVSYCGGRLYQTARGGSGPHEAEGRKRGTKGGEEGTGETVS